MFVIELVVPFMIFAPRRPRMIAAVALGLLQVAIILTGNYTFFNWLTLALCLPLLDDAFLRKVLPCRFTARYEENARRPMGDSGRRRRWLAGFMMVPVALLVCITAVQLAAPFRGLPGWTTPVMKVYNWVRPLRSINSYGLFAVMTTERPEILVEGSNDGVTWQVYEFRHKPGDPSRRPGFVAPHQPRLDWQMWFAALGNVRQNPWFVNFCVRLLQGEREVLALLETNPFPDQPPKYVRARLYDYSFTTREERRETGDWWKREYLGEYLPPISLERVEPRP